MLPTINEDDIVIAKRWPLIDKANVPRGSVVILRSPVNPREMICKRVKAIEDDEVKHEFTKIRVPKGYVWIEGDNYFESKDSREYGPVPSGLITGVVVYKIWPFNQRRHIR